MRRISVLTAFSLTAALLSACLPTIEPGDALRYDGERLTLEPLSGLVVYAYLRVQGEIASPYCDAPECALDADGWRYLSFEPSASMMPPLNLATGPISRAEVVYLIEGERVSRSDSWP